MAKMMLRKLALLAFLSSLACSAAALTVSIVPSEGKGYAPPPDGSGSPLRFLVSGCLDRLFDAGYVVTDANADRVSRSDWGLGGVAAGILLGLHEGWPMARCLELGVCAAASCLFDSTTSGSVMSMSECLGAFSSCRIMGCLE